MKYFIFLAVGSLLSFSLQAGILDTLKGFGESAKKAGQKAITTAQQVTQKASGALGEKKAEKAPAAPAPVTVAPEAPEKPAVAATPAGEATPEKK